MSEMVERVGLKALAAANADRFWAKVAKGAPDECWPWRGALIAAGYGCLSVTGRWPVKAYKIAVALDGREVPAGYCIDHICRNRACCNPAHLRVVDMRTNTLENSMSIPAINAQKTHCPKGHEYTPENTRIQRKRASTSRICRTCANQYEREKWARTYIHKRPRPALGDQS